jgi:hypothetical protein
MVKILVAHEMPETCFLFQALLYRAVNRLPLEASEDEAVNLVLTPEECRVGGLEPDPEWEEIENEDGESLLNALVAAPAGSDERKRLHEQRIKWKAVQEWRRNEWNHGFQELLKPHYSELLTTLREGRLRSQGQRSWPVNKEGITDDASWPEIDWESVSSTFWSSCEIDWEKNRAKGGTAAYESIIVETEDLFREFPFPRAEETGVGRIGDCFILTDEIAAPTGNLGRPPFPWDEFHLELAKHAVNGDFDEKQEAFIEEMKAWCKNRWGRSVGRSTLLQKITPYYDEFMRSKKVRK